jgi:hypothetical protein
MLARRDSFPGMKHAKLSNLNIETQARKSKGTFENNEKPERTTDQRHFDQ